MDVVLAAWEGLRRLGWRLIVASAYAAACSPCGTAAYESAMRLSDEGPGRSLASIQREAARGIAAIEAYLAEQAPRGHRRSR